MFKSYLRTEAPAGAKADRASGSLAALTRFCSSPHRVTTRMASMTTQNGEPPELHEVAPETILAEIARVIEAAIPALRLTPDLGPPVPIGAIWDVEELSEGDRALANSGQTVRALGMGIDFEGESWGGFATTSFDMTPERWVPFASQLLSQVQDVVSEATTDPWPEVRVDGRRSQAPGDASLEGRFLHMWFGSKEQRLVEFAPVQVIRD